MASFGSKGYTLTGKAIGKLRDGMRFVDSLRGAPKNLKGRPENEYPTAFRAVVVGIDVATWGAGRKLLSVQPLIAHPFVYGGAIILVDGWIDSPIVCGQEVLCLHVRSVEGDPEDQPPYVAMPMLAVDQSNLDEPAETCTTRVVTPCLQLLAQPPCVTIPEP